MTTARFLAIAVLAVIASRVLVILLTPAWGQHVDLAIYREVGELVMHGVDPYDFTADQGQRETLRQDDRGAYGFVTETRAAYDYYVSSNPPGSTALFGLIAAAAGDNPFAWRLAFMLGDVALALAGFFFLRRAGLSLETFRERAAFLALAVAWPSLIMWGTLVPEDKQFETALMLLAAGLLVRPARGVWPAFLAGAVLSASVLYKALGGLLVPVALGGRRPWQETVAGALGFALPVMAAFMFFDPAWVPLIVARAAQGAGAIHSSPWTLLPDLGFTYARPVVCAALTAGVIAAWWRGRLDALNTMAALGVIVFCLVIASGSMDRMNIAMMFALFAHATVAPERWAALVLTNFAIQAPVYGLLVIGLKLNFVADTDLPRWDAAVTVAFLVSYFAALTPRSRSSSASSP